MDFTINYHFDGHEVGLLQLSIKFVYNSQQQQLAAVFYKQFTENWPLHVKNDSRINVITHIIHVIYYTYLYTILKTTVHIIMVYDFYDL